MNRPALDKAMHAASDSALGFGNVVWLTVLIWITITSLRSMITFVNRFLCSVLIIMLNFFCYLVSVTQSPVARLSKSLAISIGNDEMDQLQYEHMKIDFNLNCYDSHNLYWLATGTSATNILIANHTLGLTSHHGIRGNYNNNKLDLSNLDIDDFTVVGIDCVSCCNIDFTMSFTTIQRYNYCNELKTLPQS